MTPWPRDPHCPAPDPGVTYRFARSERSQAAAIAELELLQSLLRFAPDHVVGVIIHSDATALHVRATLTAEAREYMDTWRSSHVRDAIDQLRSQA